MTGNNNQKSCGTRFVAAFTPHSGERRCEEVKLTSIRCPSCGGGLRIPPDRDFIFCTYCGSQIHYDDGVARCEVTHRYIDEARLRELDLLERQMREEAAEPDDDPDEAADGAEDGPEKGAENSPEDTAQEYTKKFRQWLEYLFVWMTANAFFCAVMIAGKESDTLQMTEIGGVLLLLSTLFVSFGITPATCCLYYGCSDDPPFSLFIRTFAALCAGSVTASLFLGAGFVELLGLLTSR